MWAKRTACQWGLIASAVLCVPGCRLDDFGFAKSTQSIDDEPDDEPEPKVQAKKPAKPGGKLPAATSATIPKATERGGVVDLGVVHYPDGGTYDPVNYAFEATRISPKKYRLGYALDPKEQRAIRKHFSEYATSVRYKRLTEKTFSWTPPEECPADLSCVYKVLLARTKNDVDPIALRLKARADDKKLTPIQLTELALSFVQRIPYELPNEPFGLKPPALVIAEERGDCDSKSLVLHLLLNKLGIDNVVISSKSHAHTMVAVALPTSGTSFDYRGRRYAFAETTAIGSPLGYINPTLKTPSDWRVELASNK